MSTIDLARRAVRVIAAGRVHDGPFALVPHASPRVALAVGTGFPVIQETSAAADRWEVLRPRGEPFVYVRAVGRDLVLDAQAPGQGMPRGGDPVGARTADFTLSQRWLLRRNRGMVRFVNVYSEQTLLWDPAGAGFRQGSVDGGFADFLLRRH